LNHFYFPVRFGTVLISWNSEGLVSRIEWAENRLAIWQRVRVFPEMVDLIDRIRDYFYRGEPVGPIPWDRIDQGGWSSFQRDVYRTIGDIPHGETRTYGWVASRLGNASASRAVGQALKKNPLPILIPCHRVLASASIGGFMGTADPSQPELKLKRTLMAMEEEYCNPIFSFLNPSIARNTGNRVGNCTL
jgi:methylated-DNA-[protein]-cysteine S-methyltransferase